MQKQSRADLHIHSKYSDRPNEWFLRRIGSPESFVDPLSIYKICRERGMDYITITDHNGVNGALEIAHLPDTFISTELTTYFPENECKIHCLVWNITEKIFKEINLLRGNIYELQQYLHANNILHAIAHPLFAINNSLTIDIFEKLLLLFKRFEGLNGSRQPRAELLARTIFENLSPELITQLANKHGIEPVGPKPWEKWTTGGSDDHSGLYIAQAYTETHYSPTIFDFFDHLHKGEHKTGGRNGTSLRFAHNLYNIAFNYYKTHFLEDGSRKQNLIKSMLKHLIKETKKPSRRGFKAIISKPIKHYFYKKKTKKLNDIERMLVDEIKTIFKDMYNKPGELSLHNDNRKFQAACYIGHHLTFTFIQRFFTQLKHGGLIESIQSFASLIPVFLGLAPYFTAFGLQHKDKKFLDTIARHFPGTQKLLNKPNKIAWFTDTFTQTSIKTITTLTHQNAKDITAITCLASIPQVDFCVKNFTPVGFFEIKENHIQQQFIFPPFLEILQWLEDNDIDELIISSIGPMGITALIAARLLKLKTNAICHTQFPQSIKDFSENKTIEKITWKFMHWFYENMDSITVPNHYYLDLLISRNVNPNKIKIIER
jgi:predicted metal-dependent phosphoesterase TrpH